MCRLYVFRGGFKREAAEQVASATRTVLASLVNKSLLRRSATHWYEMHEFLRQRAEVKLPRHAQEKEHGENRHGRYYAAFLQQREISAGGNPKQSGEEITTEIENIGAAWRWALAGARVKELGQSLEGLWGFYDACGWFKEGEESFGQALERLMEEVVSRGTKKRGNIQEEENTRLEAGSRPAVDAAGLVLLSPGRLSEKQGGVARWTNHFAPGGGQHGARNGFCFGATGPCCLVPG